MVWGNIGSEIHTAYYNQDNTHPGTYFRAGFLLNMGGTRDENGGFGNTSSRRLYKCVARRIEYALNVVEKPCFGNRPRGVCYIIPLV